LFLPDEFNTTVFSIFSKRNTTIASLSRILYAINNSSAATQVSAVS